MDFLKSAWAHATCRFWGFPNLLGIKVNDSITRDLGQPSFVRGCIVGQPSVVCQTLDHSECLWMLSPEKEKPTLIVNPHFTRRVEINSSCSWLISIQTTMWIQIVWLQSLLTSQHAMLCLSKMERKCTLHPLCLSYIYVWIFFLE